MGKKVHLTFKKGHLIFGRGCIRTPRTPRGTPLKHIVLLFLYGKTSSYLFKNIGKS